jgi:hypothetical protein
MKLKRVDALSGGRMRFRKRYPKAVIEVLGEPASSGGDESPWWGRSSC